MTRSSRRGPHTEVGLEGVKLAQPINGQQVHGGSLDQGNGLPLDKRSRTTLSFTLKTRQIWGAHAFPAMRTATAPADRVSMRTTPRRLRGPVDPVGVHGKRGVGLDRPGVERRRCEDPLDQFGRAPDQCRVEVKLAGHAPRPIGRPEEIRRLTEGGPQPSSSAAGSAPVSNRYVPTQRARAGVFAACR